MLSQEHRSSHSGKRRVSTPKPLTAAKKPEKHPTPLCAPLSLLRSPRGTVDTCHLITDAEITEELHCESLCRQASPEADLNIKEQQLPTFSESRQMRYMDGCTWPCAGVHFHTFGQDIKNNSLFVSEFYSSYEGKPLPKANRTWGIGRVLHCGDSLLQRTEAQQKVTL